MRRSNMTYKLYQLKFVSSHFGAGNLEFSESTFSADRLFSALVLEAIKSGKLDEWMQLSQSDDFVLSDAFPYYFSPFLPKPIGYPTFDKLDQNKDAITLRQEAKKTKKLQYIEYSMFSDFLNGESIENENYSVQMSVTKNRPNEDGGLFQVGIWLPSNESVSLYVIANQTPLFDDLMGSLQYSGLGGKRTSGYGGFELQILDLPTELAERLTLESKSPVMTLTTCLPIDGELEMAMDGANYLLKKSSGFAFSQSVSENFRKQDLFRFKAGSTFQQTFKGQIVDVRPEDFPHPVWNYAKALFYRLEE